MILGMGSRVLLVEDDPDLQLTTRRVLERHGFDVTAASDGIEALDVLDRHEVDLAVVDVLMPRMDGITLLKRIRETSLLPIVLLTARDLPHDQLTGFAAGADDYVIKPFDGDVLAARLQAALRRGRQTPVLSRGDLVIDSEGMTLERAGQPVTLSATEFRLLNAFLDNVGIVLTRDRLLALVWEDNRWGDARVVDVNIQRLRAKIGADQIVTLRGSGYKMPRA